MIGPNEGPKKADVVYIAMGIPIWSLSKISAMAPPATLRKADPKKPDRNLPNMTPAMVPDQIVRHCHMILSIRAYKNVILRPYSSLSGDKNKGPIPRPKTYSVIPRVLTSCEI